MARALEKLIRAVRGGNASAEHDLVEALRKLDDVGKILEMLASEHPGLRRSGVRAAAGRTEADILEAMRRLVEDRDETVRAALADGLLRAEDWPLADVAEALLMDSSAFVRRLAAQAGRARPSMHATMLERLGQEYDWEARKALAEGLGAADARTALPVLVRQLANDGDPDVGRACANGAEGHITTLDGYPEGLDRPRGTLLQDAVEKVRSLGARRFPRLFAWLEEHARVAVDPEFLGSVGTDLTAEAEAGSLPRAHGLEETAATVIESVTGASGRSIVLLGVSGVGKTALMHEVVHRLRDHPGGGWRVVRVSAADIMAGTLYLGEWQTKVRGLIQAVSAPKRVILYVPNLEELADAGKSSQSSLNIASMLAPHIESGAIALIGESTPEAYDAGLGRNASLRRLFAPVSLRATDAGETRAILDAVRDEAGIVLDDGALDRMMELADYYLTGSAQPGRAVGLLRSVIEKRDANDTPLATADVLRTLSVSTGLPVSLLDDDIPLDPRQVREFFESRVMGQPEGVAAVVDVVTLVKAGLTDPDKPFGILLFVGPTGVGKTELARALAELLFGDPARLTRLDMSEFATFDAFERLIGRGKEPGLLTRKVADQPFSVVLLDEIEKAHTNVFDLCLQIFDAGRLTETSGRTTDFRRTIIILTSNVGSHVPTEAAVGFAGEAPAPPDAEATIRDLRRFFRPEFLNRIDHIVSFRQLDEKTAERIARREVARVLERSGIKRRELALDIEPAVFALLLRQGYSPAFGARPLKRTVERLLLLPVARAIACGTAPSGSVMRLIARGDHVVAELVPPPGAETAPPADPDPDETGPHRASMDALRGGAEELLARVDALRELAEPLAKRKSAALAETREPGFWDRPAHARGLLDAIHRFEGLLEPFARLEKEASQLHGRARRLRPSSPRPTKLTRWLAKLAAEHDRLAFLLSRTEGDDLGDALVTVTLVQSQGGGLDGVERLGRMYLGLAKRREFDHEVLDDHLGGEPREDSMTLLVSGVGAFGVLRAETGLHQLSRTVDVDGRPRDNRDVVRVDVLPAPTDDGLPDAGDMRVETRPLRETAGRLIRKPDREITLLHVPTMTSVRAWTDRPKKDARKSLAILLRARMRQQDDDAPPPDRPPPDRHVVRRYVLGPSPLVRDLASGRTTGHLDRVLKGNLDLFFHVSST